MVMKAPRKIVNAGMLRHPIRIQSPSEEKLTNGSVEQIWTTYGTPRAAIRAITGSERYVAEQEVGFVSHHFYTRTKSARLIRPAHRILLVNQVDKVERCFEILWTDVYDELPILSRITVLEEVR